MERMMEGGVMEQDTLFDLDPDLPEGFDPDELDNDDEKEVETE